MQARSRLPVALVFVAAPACGSDADPTSGGPVTVTVSDRGAPTVGARVWFVNPGGLVTGVTTTDAQGQATDDVVPGATVTVLEPFPSIPDNIDSLVTTTDVRPGDELVYAHPRDPVFQDQVSVQISIGPDPGADVATHILYSPCIGPSGYQLSIIGGRLATGTSFPATCPSTDVIVASVDANGRLLRSFVRRDVPISDGITITLDEPYVPTVDVNLAFANAPAGITTVPLVYDLMTSGGPIVRLRGTGTVTGGTLGVTFQVPQGTFDTRISGDLPLVDVELGERSFVAWNATSFDLAPFPRPFASTPAWDGTHLTWSPAPMPTDVAKLTIEVLRTDRAWRHVVVARAGDGRVKLPALPVQAFDYNIGSSDLTYVKAATVSTSVGGYDAVREHAFEWPVDASAVPDTLTAFAPSLLVQGDRGVAMTVRLD